MFTNFGMIFQRFSELTLGGGGRGRRGRGLKIMENLLLLDLGVVEHYQVKEIIRRRILDSPPAKQGASDLISRITALCVYLFNPNSFPSQINLISPPKNNQNAPLM